MSNARIGYLNYGDAANITGPAQILTPVSRLKTPDVGVKWQGNTGASSLVYDFGAPKPIDCARWMGLTADTIRVRYSTSTPGEGDLFDTQVLTIDQRFKTFTDIRSIAPRFIRVDLVSATVCEAGRHFIGPLSAFAFNFSYGWTRQWVDPSDRKKTEGGQTRINRKTKYRLFKNVFESLSEAEMRGFIDDLERINGLADDVLLVLDPDSAAIEQDSIWGLFTDLAPTSQPFFDRWSKALSIEQRL